MRRRYNCIWLLLAAALLLTGCMKTVDQLYRLPKRSDEFTELQLAIDDAMSDLNYCAPHSGENQQAVQMADLDGDGDDEYLVYAENDEQPQLSVLIFAHDQEGYSLVRQLQCSGVSFDMVEYTQIDEYPGVELVLGSQLSENLQRNVEVYTFFQNLEPDLLLSAKYTEFLVLDLNQDRKNELFILKPGPKETDPGIVELYQMQSNVLNCSNEVSLSAPAANLKRLITGCIHGGVPAVFAATTANDTSLISDVYILKNDKLCNVTVSGDSETSIRTLRTQYVYAEDIDHDGVIELPYLMPMMPMDNMVTGGKQELIRWYAMKSDGDEVVKAYTFHNFTGSWYFQLNEDWAHRLTVVSAENTYEFYIWDEDFQSAIKVLTIIENTGAGTSAASIDSQEILLHEDVNLRLTACLEDPAQSYGINNISLQENFHMIHQNWETGEI